MPIYEYRCSACTNTFEVFAKMSDPDPTACEHCGEGPVDKVLHPAAVHYKGSGFYATDYAGRKKAESSPSSTDSGSSGSKEGASGGSDGGGSSSSTSSSGSASSGASDA